MQKHWDVMRSDDAGENWREISGNLPSDFGFPIDVHAHEPETVYVVPIKSDSLHYPPDGKLRVYRSRTGGNEWEALTKGLPQSNCYVNVLRDAMAVDSLDSCGVYFGTTGGQVYVLAGRRGQLGADRPGPAGRAVGGGPDAAMIRVVLPAHLRTLAGVDGEVVLDVEAPVTLGAVLDALEAKYPMLRGTIRDHVTRERRAFVRFFACEEDLSHDPPDAPLPGAVASGAEPFLVVGAIAGGSEPTRRRGLRTLGRALAVVGALLALLLVVVAMQPAEFRVTRRITIGAPPSAVFAEVHDFHRWESWNPWARIDPGMRQTYEGAPAGVGAVYAWAGNHEVGEGRMTLTESRPNELIRIRLEFLKPLAATSTAEFTFEPAGEPAGAQTTAVTWSMTGRSSFMAKAIHVLMNMDRMIGGQFEVGLARMKAVAETAAKG